MIALSAARLFTPLTRVEHPLVLIDGGVIADVTVRTSREAPTNCRVVDLGDTTLAPGFVDIHIHGGAGHDVMEDSASGQQAMERFLAAHGVCSYFPTTVTSSIDKTLAALDCLGQLIESAEGASGREGAQPLGIHLEGPFISHARRGVHPLEHLLTPTVAMFQRFWDASRGKIKVMTIAPEVEGAVEVIAEAARRGVCVSLGHSDADLGAARRGLAAGARHATHTFNAMRALGHRDPGILGEVLTNPAISADIIADGFHLDPSIVDLFLRLKGAEGTVLITDGIAATGMPDGRYRLGSIDVDVSGGKCMAGGVLAGSVLTMDRAVRNTMEFGKWDLGSAVRAASWNPAQITGFEKKKGQLAVGSDADITVLSPTGEVRQTIIKGLGL
jgi:N-acetylglucosamine-6-phosphate deacetylase